VPVELLTLPFFFLLLVVRGIEPTALCMRARHSATWAVSQPFKFILFFGRGAHRLCLDWSQTQMAGMRGMPHCTCYSFLFLAFFSSSAEDWTQSFMQARQALPHRLIPPDPKYYAYNYGNNYKGSNELSRAVVFMILIMVQRNTFCIII
jgi:hypothetical protein